MCGCLARGWPNRWQARTHALCLCHLADSALLDLVRPGDVVDVLAAGTSDAGADARPQLMATDAVVVLVSEKPKGAGNGSDRVVLVALPAHAANDVAAAALVQTVTLTFH